MRVRDLSTIDSHAAADRYLKGRARRILAHNTTIRRDGDDIVVTYHATDIVRFHGDGDRITLDDGGWATATTVARLRAMTPAYVRVRRESVYDTYDGERYLSGHHTAVKVPGNLERRIPDGGLTIYV